VAERRPGQLALALARADPRGEQQPLGVERIDDRPRRPGSLEGLKQVAQRLLHGRVGIEHDLAARILHQPDRERHRQLAAAGLGQDPALQPGADEVKLRFGHRALEPEQEPVVEIGRVIEPVLVADQRAGQRADLEQPVPVGVVARQAGDLEAEHDPGLAEPDVGDQPLEPLTAAGACAGLALVGVDHDDLLGRPAELHGSLAERVLALGRLAVVLDLAQGRLAHIEIRGARQMLGGDLLRERRGAHERSPRRRARERHARERAHELAAGRRQLDHRRRGRFLRLARGRRRPRGARPRRHSSALQQRQPEPEA
jgi:hypothetical protein